MAAQLSAEQQAIVDLQAEMTRVTDQLMRVSAAHDGLQAAHTALNNAAAAAMADKDTKIKESEDRLRSLLFRQQFDLLESKDMKPATFKGKITDAFKPW